MMNELLRSVKSYAAHTFPLLGLQRSLWCCVLLTMDQPNVWKPFLLVQRQILLQNAA